MTIAELKERISIDEVVGRYTELIGTGNKLSVKENPLREERTPSFFVYQNTQKFFDYGSGDGGDVVDFIEKVEKLSRVDAISFLQANYLGGADASLVARPLPRTQAKPLKKNNDYLLAQLERKANIALHAICTRTICGIHRSVTKWGYFTLETEDKNGNIESKEMIQLAPIFEKLFEGYLVPSDKKFAEYLFSKVIGYDAYFNCPVIIIRDESEKVVDIVRYRPERDGKPLDMKYLYTKSEEKPDSVYLFPLQAQMQRMMIDQGYCYVGEGLKNAINASMQGIPFISIEGAGSIKPSLIKFLQSDRMKGIVMIGAFDSDEAGERAYKKINAEIPMDNKFDFNSGIDFAEYLKDLK